MTTETNDGEPPKPKRVVGRPFQKGNPGRPVTWTPERVIEALKATRGNYTKTALKLSDPANGVTCDRATISRLVRKHPRLQKACEEAWIAALEVLHDDETRAALKGNERARALILTRFHPGYRQKQEFSGPGGGPIEITARSGVNKQIDEQLEGVNIKLLTHAEQIELANLLVAALRQPPLSTEHAERMAALIQKGRGQKQIEGPK